MVSDRSCYICHSSVKDLYINLFDNRHGYPDFFTITCCPSCGYCRTEPSLKRENLAEIYEKYYPRKGLTSEQIKKEFEQAQKKTKFKIWLEGGGTECYYYIQPNTRVLDVGCGSCVSLLMARKLGAKEVIGIEVDPNLQEIAQTLNLNLYLGQLSELPSEKGKFDFILARQVLEHDPEPEKLLIEMRNRLSENGQIVLSFPNVNSIYRYIFKDKWLHWHVPYHINHFSRESIEILIKKCQLTIQNIKTITPNNWINYQLRNAKVSIECGQKDPFWNLEMTKNIQLSGSEKEFNYLSKLLIKATIKLRQYTTYPFLYSFNRFVDTLGLGESWVVILSKSIK